MKLGEPFSIFEQIALELGKLVTEKNAAYGDSFAKSAKFLELLYPDGVKPSQYQDMLALIRDFDKSARIATNEDAFGENPWGDKAGYAILSVAQRRIMQPSTNRTQVEEQPKSECRKAPLKLCSESCCTNYNNYPCTCEVPLNVANKT